MKQLMDSNEMNVKSSVMKNPRRKQIRLYNIYIYISHQSDKRNIINLNIAHPCEGMVVGGAFEG